MMLATSIILPVHNAEKWLQTCLQSVLDQEGRDGAIQLSVFLDGCTDNSANILEAFRPALEAAAVELIVSEEAPARGVGYAKNRAVEQSSARFLCFLDADDEMLPCRVRCQHAIAASNPNAIVGGRFRRDPPDSTHRYTTWANSLTERQLHVQTLTAHGPTVIMPTWYCSRQIYDSVGGFDESGRGTPEDLIFFYRHLDLGGIVLRAPEPVLVYRYHPAATTFSIHEDSIWSLRLRRLCDVYLNKWCSFTIWNAGKQGRKLYRQLPAKLRAKVSAFCDVDARKLKQGVYTLHECTETPRPSVPIVHFSEAQKPFVICVKMGLTGGQFEENLNSLHLTEGDDYVMFS